MPGKPLVVLSPDWTERCRLGLLLSSQMMIRELRDALQLEQQQVDQHVDLLYRIAVIWCMRHGYKYRALKRLTLTHAPADPVAMAVFCIEVRSIAMAEHFMKLSSL